MTSVATFQVAEKRASAELIPLDALRRPRVRGECVDAPRPCPWVSCKYHLLIGAFGRNQQKPGGIKINPAAERPHDRRQPWDWTADEIERALVSLAQTCALDVADSRDVRTLDELGKLLGCTRERMRQLEGKALRRLRLHKGVPR